MGSVPGRPVSGQRHVCLLSNDLGRIPWAIHWARRSVAVIRQNLFWSLVYNTLGIGLAATGRLNPIWAAAAMVLSSLLVVANSLRLQQPLDGDSGLPPEAARTTPASTVSTEAHTAEPAETSAA